MIGDCLIDVLLFAMLFSLVVLEVFLIFDDVLYGLFALLNWLEVVLLDVLAAA